MTIFPSEKGVSARRKVFQPTKETPIKPSLLIITNAKDNDITDLIYVYVSLIPCCSYIGRYTPLRKHDLS